MSANSIPPPERGNTLGLVLAGGRGARLGGIDKGWLEVAGIPLARRVADRLRPQVSVLAFSANRDHPRYAALSDCVWADDSADHPGPLAGLLGALRRSPLPWLLSAPVDAPALPAELFARLAAPAGDAPRFAVAAGHGQPLCALVPQSALPVLEAAWAAGERSPATFLRSLGALPVEFPQPAWCWSLNTAAELAVAELQLGSATASGW